MSMQRRVLMRRSLAAGTVGVAAATGLLQPRAVLAAWPQAAFAAGELDETMTALFGGGDPVPSTAIEMQAPDIAENGASVPVTVQTSLGNVESISILVENNPWPLAASFEIGAGVEGYVSTRIKMSETSRIVAVVKADGQLHSASREVKVTIGGCGG